MKDFRNGRLKNPDVMPAVERIDDIGTLIDLFGGVARGQLSDCVKSLDARTGEGARSEDAWNDTSVELTQAAMAHTRYYVVKVVGFQTFTLRRLFGKKMSFCSTENTHRFALSLKSLKTIGGCSSSFILTSMKELGLRRLLKWDSFRSQTSPSYLP